MKKLGLSACFLFIAFATALGQQPEIREIKIASSWGGLGTPAHSGLTITRTKRGYRANGDDINRALVDKLISALYAPEVRELDAPNLGITEEWLKLNAEPAALEYEEHYISIGAPNQQELFLTSFRDPKFIEGILPNIFRGGWTDDSPMLSIEVTEMSGNRFVVRSNAQPIYMLPFEIEKNGSVTQTFNSNISRSLADLLPKKFVNKERIAGGDLRRKLSVAVMSAIKDEWKRLDAENKVGPSLAELKKNYSIVSAEINANHGADHGKEWLKGNPTEKNLHVLLRSDAMADRFAIRLILPYVDGKAQNLELFSSGISNYQNLVSSVDWLKELVESGRGSMWLRFVKDASFSEKALETFTEDMHVLGKPELAAEVARHRREIALVSTGGGLDFWQSFWLVMPDRRVILWRYNYEPGLKWTAKDFASQTCPTYDSGRVQCAGAVISPDGQVMAGRAN